MDMFNFFIDVQRKTMEIKEIGKFSTSERDSENVDFPGNSSCKKFMERTLNLSKEVWGIAALAIMPFYLTTLQMVQHGKGE